MIEGNMMGDAIKASVCKGRADAAGLMRAGRFSVECRRPDGTLKWAREFDNLVVNQGLDDSLDKHLKGSAYTAAWYLGLVTGPGVSVAAGDTYQSHAGWTENTTYDEATRPALTLGAVASQSVNNSGNLAVFTMSGAATIGGAFLASENTKGASGAGPILYSAGAFAEGDTTVADNDVINVQYTATAAAA